MKKGIFQRRTSFIIVIAVLLLSLVGVLAFQLRNSLAHPAIPGRSFAPVLTGSTGAALFIPGTKPPTDAQCRAGQPAGLGGAVACLSPQEMRNTYNVTPLLNAGFTGKGQTIVIFDAIGSPTITNDLKVFDAGYGLPDPPSFQIVAPLGTATFDPNHLDDQAWAFETTLDVEWAHVIAPDANIVLATSPVDETQGVAGMPELLDVEQFVLNHHMGQIFSQSWGTTENTLFDTPGRQVLHDFEAFYERAAAEHISVLASAGDEGTSNFDVNGNTLSFPTVIFPASSPLVTAVGGTSLKTDTNGNYQSETVWNDTPKTPKATAGGPSQFFPESSYQRTLLPPSNQKQLDGFRGVPDIAYNADPQASAILAFCSFLPGKAGYFLFGGTSEGVPQWSGIIAIANQMAHHPLGFLNPLLYKLGHAQQDSVYHDITVGDNTGVRGVAGFNAAPGWDLVTGWGTPKADALVHELAEVG